MAINRIIGGLLLFLLFPCVSFAQNADSPAQGGFVGSDREGNSFRVVDTPQGPQIIQRLSWLRDEHDFRYEVIIESQDKNGEYTEILRESRTENFIELSLSIGRYRYRVLVYNLLDRLEYSTNWAVFSIDRARRPALARIRPNRFTLNSQDLRWVIELEGTNLLPESEISLRPLGGEGAEVKPREYTAFPGETRGQAVFYAEDLTAGLYELCVRNPGGFEARLVCTVKAPFSFDLFVSASYAPALPAHGYLKDLFGGSISPLGFALWADFLPYKKSWGALGIETFISWNYLSLTQTGTEASANLFNFQANLLYQYPLSPQLALALRLGGGQTLVLDLAQTLYGTPQLPVSTWIPSLDGGLSLKWIFHNHGFTELGLHYVHLFSVDGPQGLLLPFIGLGGKY